MGLSNGKGDIFGALFFRGAQKADPLRGHMVRYRTNKEKKDFGFKMWSILWGTGVRRNEQVSRLL